MSSRKISALLVTALLAVPVARGQLLADISHELVGLSSPRVAALGKHAVVSVDGQPRMQYTGVAFSALTDDPELTGRIRFLSDAGAWSVWHALYLVRSETDRVIVGGYRSGIVRDGQPFELEFAVAAGRFVQFTGSGVFDNRRDEDEGAISSTDTRNGPAASPDSGVLDVVPPVLITRTEWEAEPFRGTPVALARPGINYMTFHHAAGFTAETLEEGLAQVKAIQDLHQNVRGWSDIGYQFVIDRGGRMYQGRPFLDSSTSLEQMPVLAMGAHVGGNNTGNIGICLLGCYHPSEGSYCEEEITPEAYSTYVTAFAFLSESYEVGTDQIRGHRDFSSTACPGDNNYVLLPDIRADAEELKQNGSQVPTPLPETFTLAQAFPNPFRSESTIRYFLAADGHVLLQVHNSLGRQVAVLVDQFQDGGAWYSVTLPSGSLASGTYYYHIAVEGFRDQIFREVKALVLIR